MSSLLMLGINTRLLVCWPTNFQKLSVGAQPKNSHKVQAFFLEFPRYELSTENDQKARRRLRH
jgi:hypothetical protein